MHGHELLLISPALVPPAAMAKAGAGGGWERGPFLRRRRRPWWCPPVKTWGEAFLKERRVSIWMKSFQGNFERAAATGITWCGTIEAYIILTKRRRLILGFLAKWGWVFPNRKGTGTFFFPSRVWMGERTINFVCSDLLERLLANEIWKMILFFKCRTPLEGKHV